MPLLPDQNRERRVPAVVEAQVTLAWACGNPFRAAMHKNALAYRLNAQSTAQSDFHPVVDDMEQGQFPGIWKVINRKNI